MTKIVKTIDKVTNHENMRRYLHKKASKGGGGEVTYDDVVKYYTNGRYSKFEDIPVVRILSFLGNNTDSPAVDDIYAPELYISTTDITINDNANDAQVALERLRLANLSSGDFVRIGNSKYFYKVEIIDEGQDYININLIAFDEIVTFTIYVSNSVVKLSSAAFYGVNGYE
jgi:hypothetical protein